MKKSIGILLTLTMVMLVAPASAKIPTLVVDDDALDCPDADYSTIQEAIDDPNGVEKIKVCSGEYAGALVDKSVEIVGAGDVTINYGPVHGSGLIQGFRMLAGSDGSEISHLTFEVDLAIMNGAAVSDVSIHHNTFLNAIQAVTNWRGNGWTISHNRIVDLRTRNGGGIGILVADYLGGTVSGNVVSHNTIEGTLKVYEHDGGGYDGSGIVLYADFRWGGAGALAIKDNSVVKNTVSLVSDTPDVVDVHAFELTDTRDDVSAIPYPVLFDNAIGFNDWRGTASQMVFMPEELEAENEISRNLGDYRGHGSHPSAFGPGGN